MSKSQVVSDYDIPPGLPTQADENYKDPYTMTEEILTKRLEKRYHGRCVTQVFAAIVASIGAIIFGLALGWSSPAFSRVTKVSKEQRGYYSFSWIASMVPLGICVGNGVWSYLNIKVGPRKSMLIQFAFLMFTWLFIAAKDVERHFYMACRFFCGFFSVSYIICGESLLIDAVDVGYLRDCEVFFRSCIYLGVLVIYMGGQLIKEKYFSFVPPGFVIVHSIMLSIAPESPVFLFSRNEKLSMKALRWYRGKVSMTAELKDIKRSADIRKVDPESHKYMLYSKVVVKGLLIVVGLMVFQVFTGYYAFIFFNQMIWHNYGGVYFGPYIDTVIFGLCLFMCRLLSLRIHYSIPYGVRKPLLLSMILVVASLSVIVVYCLLWELEVKIVYKIKWFPLVAVNIYIMSYEMGLSVLPRSIIYDYMPYQVYPRAKTIVVCVHWFCVFLLTKLFTVVNLSLGKLSYCFMVNLTFAVIGCFYIFIFVVETKGQSLVQIQLAIGGNPIGSRSVYRKQRQGRK